MLDLAILTIAVADVANGVVSAGVNLKVQRTELQLHKITPLIRALGHLIYLL